MTYDHVYANVINMEPQPDPNTTPASVEVSQDQYAAALAMVRGVGRINPDSFADDLRWHMGERDPRTGEITTPSDIVTSPTQAARIIEDLQSRGVLSTEADEEGVLSRHGMPARQESATPETVKSPGRLRRAAKKIGKLSTDTATNAAGNVTKQTREFAGYNPVSELALRIPRQRREKARTERAKDTEKERNIERFEQEHSRREALKVTPKEVEQQGRREQRRPRASAKDIAELVKLKVISPEEGRTMLGDAIPEESAKQGDQKSPQPKMTPPSGEPKAEATPTPKPPSPSSIGARLDRAREEAQRRHDSEAGEPIQLDEFQLKIIDERIGAELAKYLRQHGDSTPEDQQIEDKKQIRERIVREFEGAVSDSQLANILQQLRSLRK